MRIATLILTACLAGGALGAAAANVQQDKMKTCNAEATDQHMTADDRKAFMKTCLSADSKAGTLTPQQEKMKTCNADPQAKTLKGEARKTFMSNCLKAK